MVALLLLAFAPNALFMEHWVVASAHSAEPGTSAAAHAGHQRGGSAPEGGSATDTPAQQPAHCHVGPESCAASSGLSNAIVIAAALALTLVGGGVMLLATIRLHLSLFDLTRRITEPPRVNLLSV